MKWDALYSIQGCWRYILQRFEVIAADNKAEFEITFPDYKS